MLALNTCTSTRRTWLHYGELACRRLAASADRRLLAHAGYDPREAMTQFATSLTELEELDDTKKKENPWWNMFKLFSWGSHPAADDRVEAMATELNRWKRVEDGLESA